MNEPLLSEVDGLTLGQALRRSGARWPDQDFFKTADVSVSFLQFDQRVDQFARALLALGLKRQDHVAVWLGNSLEWALTFCACARIGAVLVPINTRYTASEAGYILAQSDAKALVMTSVLYGLNYLEMLEQIAPSLAEAQHDLLELKELPALKRVILSEPEHATMQAISVSPLPVYAVNLEALMQQAQAHEQLQAAERTVSVEDVLLICYTSGTTGKPKGVMHNHRVLKQATRVGLALDLKPGGRILGHMPLYHVAGLYMGFVPALTLGACFVNMPQWETTRALDLLEQERITAFGGIPTHFVDLVNHPSVTQRDLSSVENAWIGGSPVMQATFEKFKTVLGLKQLMSTYGMTENTISTSFNRLSDPIEVC